jgi:diketogulonate reductase-like aldo/keto reductase
MACPQTSREAEMIASPSKTSAPLVEAHGARIPALGFGTWQLRGSSCRQAVAAALGIGYRHIDTAAIYGNETEVGEGIRDAAIARDDIFVTTKVWTDSLRDGALQRSAEASLKRLGLSKVDLLLVHWPNESVPLGETIGALCDAKRRGLTQHIGVSNYSESLLRQACALASEPLVTNQCKYHLHLEQSALLDTCRELGVSFTAYTPLGRGEIVRDPVVMEIARAHQRTPAQIALRWLVQQEGVITIPKAANPAHISENFAIFDFVLDEDAMQALFERRGRA